jgi:voltage-gated potassium channel Kch
MRKSPWYDNLSERALTFLVILEILALFVVGPLSESGHSVLLLEFILALFIFSASAAVVWRTRAAVIVVLAAFIIGGITTFLREDRPSNVTLYVDFVAKIAFLLAVSFVVGRAVFGPGRVTLHRIRGAVAIYLQASLVFAFAYILIARLNPSAFNPPMILRDPFDTPAHTAPGGYNLIYFSLVTLTSTGYGDIVPIQPIARSLANLEAVIGQLFPAIVLARLVTLEAEGRHQKHTPDDAR